MFVYSSGSLVWVPRSSLGVWVLGRASWLLAGAVPLCGFTSIIDFGPSWVFQELISIGKKQIPENTLALNNMHFWSIHWVFCLILVCSRFHVFLTPKREPKPRKRAQFREQMFRNQASKTSQAEGPWLAGAPMFSSRDGSCTCVHWKASCVCLRVVVLARACSVEADAGVLGVVMCVHILVSRTL